MFGHRAEDQRGDAAPAVAADHDQVAAEFPGLVGDGFGNAALAGFEQQRLDADTFDLLDGIVEQLTPGVDDGLERIVEVERGREGAVVHAHQGFVGNVGDIQLGAAATGDMGGFGQGAARGFAVVDGDQNVFVHGVFSCVGNSMALSYQVGIASAVREILRAACAGQNAALAAVFST